MGFFNNIGKIDPFNFTGRHDEDTSVADAKALSDASDKRVKEGMAAGRERAAELYGMGSKEIGTETQDIMARYKARLDDTTQSKQAANVARRAARSEKGQALTGGESAQLSRSAEVAQQAQSDQNLAAYKSLMGNIAANTGSLEMGYGNIGVAGQTPAIAASSGDMFDDCCWLFLEARYGDGKMDSIVRRFRDEAMTDKNKRGYYKLSAVLVPLMRRSRIIKFIVQAAMTTPMFYYGKYYYGENKLGIVFTPIAKFWLSTYDYLGGNFEFIRENGEVI